MGAPPELDPEPTAPGLDTLDELSGTEPKPVLKENSGLTKQKEAELINVGWMQTKISIQKQPKLEN